MKGAENTELCSLGGLSLKTHEITRTAKQHFWETISQIVKKINAERVGAGTILLLLSRILEIVADVVPSLTPLPTKEGEIIHRK